MPQLPLQGTFRPPSTSGRFSFQPRQPRCCTSVNRAGVRSSEKQSTGIKGGKRPGAGRKKGVPNKRTAELQAQVEESGETPLAFMLRIMRTEPGEIEDERVMQSILEMRFEAAKAAAPYVHARLSSIDLKADVATHEASLDDLA
jgi:hypothetical protein